jgi:hypothetical protein
VNEELRKEWTREDAEIRRLQVEWERELEENRSSASSYEGSDDFSDEEESDEELKEAEERLRAKT